MSVFLGASGDSALNSLLQLVLQHIDHPIHFAAELILLGFIIYLWTTKSYKTVDEKLTQREEEQLIAEWKPEPLFNPATSPARNTPEAVVLGGAAGPRVSIEGEEYINFVSSGFLGYQTHPKLKQIATECARKFGVGACGPRGFYGSLSPHMELEKKLASFFKVEDCVIFSSEFQTIASVIPAFAKPGDYLIVDKGVSMSIQNGVLLARSEIIWFNHNDMNDLNRALQSLGSVFAKCKHRVFLIVESIYANSGHMLDLPAVMKFKENYPFRIILEESMAVGVLGKRGMGITEHYGIAASEIEILCGSLGNSFGGVGGFSVGTNEICNHMRLNCSGYVFSCSLPPYITSACAGALDLVQDGKDISELQEKTKILHEALGNLKHLISTAEKVSPFTHLTLTSTTGSRTSDDSLLDSIVDEMRKKHRIVLSRTKYASQEGFLPPPSIKLAISALHTDKDIVEAIKLLDNVAQSKLSKAK